MSATPPPPPSSSSAWSPAHGRPSAGPYRTAGASAASGVPQPRSSPFQQAPPPPSSSSSSGMRTATRLHPSLHSTATTQPNVAASAHVDPTAAAAPSSAELLGTLTAAVHESIAGYLYNDAIELAQRLFHLEPAFTHLHLLAHCYVLNGAVGTAYRLLQHHYPFFEVHVTRPRTASGAHGASFSDAAVVADGAATAALPLNGRRTWTATAAAGSSSVPYSSQQGTSPVRGGPPLGDVIDLSFETVDLKAQWDCQYLLGVCCYRTQHYEDGVKVLSQLLYVKHQLDAAVAALRKQQQQQQQQLHNDGDVRRRLRAYGFASAARVSQVCHWLGLCEKHRQRPPIAADYFRRSFAACPARLDSFQEYVRLAWPSEATVSDLLTVKEPLAEEEEEEEENAYAEGGDDDDARMPQRPPQRRSRDMAEGVDEGHASLARTCGATAITSAGKQQRRLPLLTLDAPALTAAQRRSLQQHLQPFLRVMYLSITYRCPEAVEALQKMLQQQQRQQEQQQQMAAGTRGTNSSSHNRGVGDDTRPGFSRFPLSSGYEQRQPSVTVASARVRSASGTAAGSSSSVSLLLLRHLALSQFHNGDVQECADTFAQLLRAAPWDLNNPALIYYSTALWHLKSEAALGGLAQRLTDAEPFSPTTLCVLANAYSLIKDPRDALVMLKRAVQVAPTLAYAHALHGYELLGQDNKAEAEAAFKTALAVDHTLYIAYAGLGERFIREEQVDRARGYYKEAVKINPTPAIMNRFALTYHKQNNSPTHLKCALRLYTESLLRHPNNITARRQRTDVLLRLDKAKEALEELKALLVLCPGEASLYMTLAECMVCLRRPQEALLHYQTAMHLDPRRESYVQGCIDRLVAAKML